VQDFNDTGPFHDKQAFITGVHDIQRFGKAGGPQYRRNGYLRAQRPCENEDEKKKGNAHGKIFVAYEGIVQVHKIQTCLYNKIIRLSFYIFESDMNRLLIWILSVSLLGACKMQENIQDGDTAYKLKKYDLAATLLQKDFERAALPDEKADIAFRIGNCYAFNNRYEQAGKWYYQASDLGYGSESLLQYAYMLKAQENYNEAVKIFNQYLLEEPYRRPEITLEIQSCEQAILWIQRQDNEFERDTYVEPLSALNSVESDFNPVIFSGNKMVFTSSRDAASGENTDSWTGDKFYDLFYADMDGLGNFGNIQPFPGPFNAAYNDGTPTFNANSTEVIFTRCGSEDRKVDDYCGLYLSSLQPDGGWSEPALLPFFEDTMNLGTPCLSPDGMTLFFAATNPDGYGGADIYYTRRNAEGWDAPVNAGQGINTNGNEVFPAVDRSGTFYFSSDKHPGMGGLDIFSATFKMGKFSNIRNMEYPINSGADDFGLVMADASLYAGTDILSAGYFTSNRKGGKGEDDLYLFTKKEKKLRPPVYVLRGMVKFGYITSS